LNVGDVAKPFTGLLLDGQTYDFSKALGHRPAVVVFWASWCRPCLLEAPHLLALHEKYSAQGVEFVSVSIDEEQDRAAVAETVAELAIVYPVVLDEKGAILKSYAAGASIPLTFVVGANGNVMYRHQNYSAGDEVPLEAAILEALKTRAQKSE
jgi:peroxiredoxin